MEEISNDKLFELILKAVEGDLSATFDIIVAFDSLIKSEARINGRYSKECEDYIVDQILKYVPRFKKIKNI